MERMRLTNLTLQEEGMQTTTETKERKENVIYKAGEMGIQTVTRIDAEGVERCMYSGLTVAEYLAKNEGCSVMTWDEVMPIINALQNEAYIKPFQEITEEHYEDMLGCLPPEKWETVDGVNIFRMSERLTGNITDHLVSYQGKYYSANRRTSTPYAEIAKEIKAI